MENNASTEIFVQRLTESQNRISRYVFSLLADHVRTSDVVQETNLVLWRKMSEYDSERPFLPWAMGIARMQVMAHIRNATRDRLLLNSETAELLAESAEKMAIDSSEEEAALRLCLHSLEGTARQMIEHRYFKARPLSELADSLGRTTSAIKTSLVRIRRQLQECVNRRVAGER